MNGHYDIIGDVHGHAGMLETLLQKLGYSRQGGCFRHPGRTAVFVGDLIDRGMENFKCLEMVKAMVDEGCASIVMGNHEYNALCYHTREPGNDGCFLRPHSTKNSFQHKAVLEEIEQKGRREWEYYLDWFRTLPLFLELEGCRVVHACWDSQGVDFFRANNIRDHNGRLTDGFLARSVKKGTGAFNAVEALLKGDEIGLPAGHPGVYDKDGVLRKRLRVKWWLPPHELASARTYEQAVRAEGKTLTAVAGLEIPAHVLTKFRAPGVTGDAANGDMPVFFGHYWFTGKPGPLTGSAACLDYSAARGGCLACYRWDGEKTLQPDKFVSV
jgi:hypothetical protein